jgi:N-acetyl-anhydromuramyl-L-alanine amidase AmpD
MVWSFEGEEDRPPENAPLATEPDREIFGWGIGHPTAGGRMFTTTHDDDVAGIVELRGDSAAEVASEALSGVDGEAFLDTTALSGSFEIVVRPTPCNDTSPVGPDFTSAIALSFEADGTETESPISDLTTVHWVYRTLRVPVVLRCGRLVEVTDPYFPPALTTSTIGATHGRVGNVTAREPTTTHLPLSLKPIWWIHPASDARNVPVRATLNPGSRTTRPDGNPLIDLVILHCTGGPRVGSALNDWKVRWVDYREKKTVNGVEVLVPKSGRKSGAQYVLDHDGHMIKLAKESEVVGSVGGQRDLWLNADPNASTNSNERSLAVEIINPNRTAPDPPFVLTNGPFTYPAEQYRALEIFLLAVKRSFPEISASDSHDRVVGHSDVHKLGDRKFDPGKRFEWERLERAGIGIRPHLAAGGTAALAREVEATIYDGVFELPGLSELRFDDRDPDASGNAKLGHSARHGFAGRPLSRIRADLRRIGYDLPASPGKYDQDLRRAVNKFVRHFFSGSRLPLVGTTMMDEADIPDDKIPLLVAQRLRQIARGPDEYEFWLRPETEAIDSRLHGGGVLGVFADAEAAARDPAQRVQAQPNIWRQDWGEQLWECWLMQPCAAIRANLTRNRAGGTGVIAVYDDYEDALRDRDSLAGAASMSPSPIWSKSRS